MGIILPLLLGGRLQGSAVVQVAHEAAEEGRHPVLLHQLEEVEPVGILLALDQPLHSGPPVVVVALEVERDCWWELVVVAHKEDVGSAAEEGTQDIKLVHRPGLVKHQVVDPSITNGRVIPQEADLEVLSEPGKVDPVEFGAEFRGGRCRRYNELGLLPEGARLFLQDPKNQTGGEKCWSRASEKGGPRESYC